MLPLNYRKAVPNPEPGLTLEVPRRETEPACPLGSAIRLIDLAPRLSLLGEAPR